MMYDIDNGKVSKLSKDDIRILKENLYKSMTDPERVGVVLTNISSRIDLMEKKKPEEKPIIADYEKTTLKKLKRKKEKRKIDFGDDKLDKVQLKALRKKLKKQSLKGYLVLNELLNASNNHSKETDKITKVKKPRSTKLKRSVASESLSPSRQSFPSDICSIQHEHPSKHQPIRDGHPLKHQPIRDGHPSKHQPIRDESFKDEACRSNRLYDWAPSIRDSLSSEYQSFFNTDYLTCSGAGLDKKSLLEYSGLMSSKLQDMLGYIHSGNIDCNNNNFDYISGLVTSHRGSPFPLEHLQDTRYNLPFLDINNSANDANPLNDANCEHFALQNNRAYFDTRARKISDKKNCKNLTVEKVENRCCCDEPASYCQHGQAGCQSPNTSQGNQMMDCGCNKSPQPQACNKHKPSNDSSPYGGQSGSNERNPKACPCNKCKPCNATNPGCGHSGDKERNPQQCPCNNCIPCCNDSNPSGGHKGGNDYNCCCCKSNCTGCPNCCSKQTNDIVFCTCCGYLFPKITARRTVPKFNPCLSQTM